jgi:hypothetical protein
VLWNIVIVGIGAVRVVGGVGSIVVGGFGCWGFEESPMGARAKAIVKGLRCRSVKFGELKVFVMTESIVALLVGHRRGRRKGGGKALVARCRKRL